MQIRLYTACIVIALFSSNCFAAQVFEQCHVVDQDGNGLIRPGMADSGYNLEGDASAWITVPWGQCAKINAGDFSGVDQSIKDKIQPSNVHNAETY